MISIWSVDLHKYYKMPMTHSNVSIHGRKVILTPYKLEHVDKFVSWYQSKPLLELMGMEDLDITRESEIVSFESSRDANEVHCFTLLDKDIYDKSQNEVESMVGDINLYEDEDKKSAEITIMVAEESSRRKGFGKPAVIAACLYARDLLKLETIFAKIKKENLDSKRFFAKMGFTVETSMGDLEKRYVFNLQQLDDLFSEELQHLRFIF